LTATATPADLDRLDDAELADRLTEAGGRIRTELAKVIVGNDDIVEQALIALFAGGNCLLVGVPGLAKTLLISTMSRALALSFSRIQFTPDLMPSDVTGTDVIQDDPETGRRRLIFMPGPVFANVLLADEINRTPPKTQSALLEAMAERSVTIEGRVHRLPDPFLVIATQNPFEQEGVFPLPESNLDRFLFKIYIDYTDLEHEVDMLRLPHTGVTPDMLGEIMPLLGIVGLDKARIELDATIVPEEVARYVVGVVRKTRVLEGVMLGASSRAAIHLMSATKANARLEGRDTVTIDDVRTMAQYVLPHRLIIEDDEVSPADALQVALDNPILSEP
jgi:MoxR-like ATPase